MHLKALQLLCELKCLTLKISWECKICHTSGLKVLGGNAGIASVVQIVTLLLCIPRLCSWKPKQFHYNTVLDFTENIVIFVRLFATKLTSHFWGFSVKLWFYLTQFYCWKSSLGKWMKKLRNVHKLATLAQFSQWQYFSVKSDSVRINFI